MLLTTEPPEPEAWLLTREVLDALPVIHRDAPTVAEPITAAVVAPDEDDEDRFAPEVLDELCRLGDTFGPLGVAIAAASLTDPRVLVASLTSTAGPRQEPAGDPHEACEEQADALRSEVARLSGLLDDAPQHRPHPGANAWPDDAVTVTYAELRRLIALHLDTLARTLGKLAPWDDCRRTARAVRDGEVPLLLSEVLDR